MKIIPLLLLLTVTSFCSSNNIFVSDSNQTILTSKTGIYDPENEIKLWIPQKPQTDKALSKINTYLEQLQHNKNSNEGREAGNILKNKNTYCVQFVGITRKGKKVIYCNFFRYDDNFKKYWKKNLVNVFDGGYWFWNIEYSIGDDKCENLSINGYA